MPGLQLYQTEMDELSLVRAAFEMGCYLVPDIHSKTPEIEKLVDLKEFEVVRVKTRHFYIFTNSSSVFSLSVRKVEKSKKAFFYVSPGVGAPSIEFLGGGIYVDSGVNRRFIRPGFLEFSREYWSIDLSQKIASPGELESVYAGLSRVLKSCSFRIKPGKSIFWLGHEARLQLDRGARLVGYESWTPDM